MKILIADDEHSMRRLLETMLTKWGYDVIAVKDGHEAWEFLRQKDPPPIAILDWMMPGLDGVAVCRKVRELPADPPPYLILLTGKGELENVIEGLHGGSDDYVTKPFDPEELHARIEVGVRMYRLQTTLMERVWQLEAALVHVKQLQGLLPICSVCKKICDDEKRWHQIEMYIAEHSEAKFNHGLCPECNEKLNNLQLAQLIQSGGGESHRTNDPVLKTQEALDYLRISHPTFMKYVRQGSIQVTWAGHGWRVKKSELDGFLRKTVRRNE